jgi:type IV secretion system protein VirB4
MSKPSGFAAFAAREQKAADRLPYVGLNAERTIVLKNGGLMQCLHLAGLSFETAETETLNHRHAVRDAALKAIASSRYVIHHHILRRRVPVALTADFPDPVSRDLDARWQARLGQRRLFVNDLFVTLTRRPARGKVGAADRLSALIGRQTNGEDRAAALAREIRELDAARDTLCAALSPYSPRLLSGYDTPAGRCSEPLELLSALFNGELRPMLTPKGETGAHLPYRRISFGLDAIERKGAGADRDFSAVLSLKEYPTQAAPGMLDGLLRLPFEMVLSESFAFVDRQIGQERVSTALRRFRAADDEAATLRRGLVEARDDLSSGRSALGEHHMTVLVRAGDLAALDGAAAECVSALADIGAVAVREDLGLEPAFWAQFPGNEDYAARRALITTGAFAGFASLHGFPIGQAEGNHWGQAISVLETTSATPYFLNLHNGDLGNFTVIGPSGSGKTVVLNFLAAQAHKLNPRTVFFDKDRGAEIFLRAIGGRYDALRAGRPTGFNPLRLPDTPANRAFLRTWLAQLLSRPDQRLDAEEEAQLAWAVEANFAQEPAFRRLRYFRELLGGTRSPVPGDLAARLAPWCGEGEQAWLFDNAEDRLDLSQTTVGFDMTELLDDPRLRTPAMMYLFHRIDERLDGTPTLILIDEGWKALDDDVFAARIRDWMKTLRKRNAVVGFGTQSARDALDSRIASAVVEQTATQIFMPNPRARTEDYCDGFGLTEHELGLIQALPAHSRCFLVKHANDSVVVRLDLSGMPDLLTVLSGREASVRRLDALREVHGDSPAAWWRALTGSDWPGAPDADPPIAADPVALPLRRAAT